MKAYIMCAIVIVGLLWCGSIGNDPDSVLLAQENAMAKRKTIRKEFLPAHDKSGVAVVLTYEGVIYTPTQEVKVVDKEHWDTSTPEASYRGVLTANKRGDTEWIPRVWVPSEREEIRELLMDEQILAKSRLIYEQISKKLLVQKIFYGNYVILMVINVNKNGTQWPLDYAFKKTEEGWLLTNELSNDKFFSILIEATRPEVDIKQ